MISINNEDENQPLTSAAKNESKDDLVAKKMNVNFDPIVKKSSGSNIRKDNKILESGNQKKDGQSQEEKENEKMEQALASSRTRASSILMKLIFFGLLIMALFITHHIVMKIESEKIISLSKNMQYISKRMPLIYGVDLYHFISILYGFDYNKFAGKYIIIFAKKKKKYI